MRVAVILILALAVGGCSNQGLRDLRTNSAGPDEFMVLPANPLAEPESYDILPPPTPGGSNRVDKNPIAEAVTSLGGRPAALSGAAVPASDGALVTASSRYGVPAGIRQSLAEADAAFRKRQSRAGRIRLFPVDRYEQAYRREALDPFDEAQRFRRAGIATPTAPPENQ